MRRAVAILSITVATLAFAAGEHVMTGRITSIDKDKGRVTVEAQGEELDLHFPAAALQNLSKGDQVTVSLGISPAGETSGTSGDMKKPGATER
jgi:hypothetical protein